MTDLRIWLALAAVVVLALLYASFGVKAALAPLCAVGSAVLWLALFGCLGLLAAGAVALYILCILAAGLLAVRHMVLKVPFPLPGFGFWFFVAASVAGVALLWAKQPMLSTWDELSLWGPAAKLAVLYDEFYVTAPAGWDWVASQLPAMYAFEYFFQFLGAGYVDWQVYAAADVLQFAALAAVLAPIENLKKNWSLALPAALAGLLVPFVFSGVRTAVRVSAVYMDSLADIPMGLVFGAALACWFCGGRGGNSGTSWDGRKGLGAMVPVGLALGTLTLMKETGVALGLVAAAVIFFDQLLEKTRQPLGAGRRAGRAFSRFGIAAGAAVLPYVGWSAYMALAAGANRLESVGGIYELSMTEMPAAFLRDLLSPDKSDFFREATGGMVKMFFTTPVWMFGSGAVVVAVIFGLLALAALLAPAGGLRRRCLVLGGFGLAGLVLYTLLLTMTYLYLFRPSQLFSDYERYINSYYIGWFLAALVLFYQSAMAGARWKGLFGRAAVLGLAALMLLRVGQLVPVNYTLAGVHPQAFGVQRDFMARAMALQARLDPAGKTFLVITDDPQGERWFQYHYYLQPWQVDYSYGGGWGVNPETGAGSMVKNERRPDGSTVAVPVTAEAWAERLAESGCTTVYIDSADEAFRAAYGGLFADNMDGYFSGETDLYAVFASEAGPVMLVPMGGQPAADTESGAAP